MRKTTTILINKVKEKLKKKKKRYSTFTDSNTQYCQDINSSLWIYKFNRIQIKSQQVICGYQQDDCKVYKKR